MFFAILCHVYRFLIFDVFHFMHGHPCSCMAIHGHAWPSMAMHGHAWPDMAIYGRIWPCMAIHGHGWPCIKWKKSKNQKAVKIAKNNEKPWFTFFWLFTSLNRCFMLNRCLHGKERAISYRSVLSRASGTPWGSRLDFCSFWPISGSTARCRDIWKLWK